MTTLLQAVLFRKYDFVVSGFPKCGLPFSHLQNQRRNQEICPDS